MEFIIAGSVVAAVVVALFVYLVVRIKRNHDGNSENHGYAGGQQKQSSVIFEPLNEATKNAVAAAKGEADVAAAAMAYFVPSISIDALKAEVEMLRDRSRAGKPLMLQTHKNRKQARRRQN